MTGQYRQIQQQQREKRVASTLPAPLGEKAIADTEHMRTQVADISTRLSLVQVALGMALEGKARATVTEVADKVLNDFDVYVMPSVAGQVFSELGVRRVSVHGQRRLVLDSGQLQPVHDSLVSRFESMKPQADEVMDRYEGLMEQVQVLEARAQRVYRQAKREEYLRDYIIKHDREAHEVTPWEERYRQVQSQVQRGADLREAIEELEQKVEDLSPLEERRQQLQDRLEQHEAEEKALSEKDKDIGKRKATLEHRGWNVRQRDYTVTLTELEQAISDKKRELDEEVKKRKGELKGLDKEIRSRRSLLDRMLGKGNEAAGNG